jgi:hypothetical protein
VLPLGLWTLFRPSPPDGWNSGPQLRWTGKLALAGAATAIVFALFAAAIDLHLRGFARVFLQHAAMRTPPNGMRIESLLEQLSLGWEPFLRGPSILLFAAVAAVSLLLPSTARAAGAALLLFAGFGALGIALYAGYTPAFAYLAAMLGSAILIGTWPNRLPRGLFSAFWWIVLSAMATPSVLCKPPQSDSPSYMALRSRVSQTPFRVLEFDEYALRGVFGFNPPPNSQSWLTCRSGADRVPSSFADKGAGEAWLVDSCKLEHFVPDAGFKADRVTLLGHRFGTLIRRPGELHFIP